MKSLVVGSNIRKDEVSSCFPFIIKDLSSSGELENSSFYASFRVFAHFCRTISEIVSELRAMDESSSF